LTGLFGLNLCSNLLSGAVPSFLQSPPQYPMNISGNYFRCPLPQYCNPQHNGVCSNLALGPSGCGMDVYRRAVVSFNHCEV